MKKKTQAPSNLSKLVAFHVTAEDIERVKRLADKHERKVADMSRHAFRRGLEAFEGDDAGSGWN